MSDPWPPEAPGEPAPHRTPAGPPPPGVEPGTAPGGGAGDEAGDATGPSANRRALGFTALAVVAFMVVAALVGGGPTLPGSPTFPPVGATVGPAGGSAAATRTDVARALADRGLQSEDATRPYRPAEGPRFASAGRAVLRAILPEDPDHGLIVIYEFPSPAAATAAAGEQARYVASGVGRVQFPPDSRFIIRVVGATAVFFAWSPANSPDPRTESIPAALESLGTGIPVPS